MPRWTRVVGDGIAYEGACVVKTIILWPHSSGRHVKVYDGRDATSGKLFARLHPSGTETKVVNLGEGVPFDSGIYVDGESSEEETTIVFEPLPV